MIDLLFWHLHTKYCYFSFICFPFHGYGKQNSSTNNKNEHKMYWQMQFNGIIAFKWNNFIVNWFNHGLCIDSIFVTYLHCWYLFIFFLFTSACNINEVILHFKMDWRRCENPKALGLREKRDVGCRAFLAYISIICIYVY